MPGNAGQVIAQIVVDTSTVKGQMDELVAIMDSAAQQMRSSMTSSLNDISSQFNTMSRNAKASMTSLKEVYSGMSRPIKDSVAESIESYNQLSTAITSTAQKSSDSVSTINKQAKTIEASFLQQRARDWKKYFQTLESDETQSLSRRASEAAKGYRSADASESAFLSRSANDWKKHFSRLETDERQSASRRASEAAKGYRNQESAESQALIRRANEWKRYYQNLEAEEIRSAAKRSSEAAKADKQQRSTEAALLQQRARDWKKYFQELDAQSEKSSGHAHGMSTALRETLVLIREFGRGDTTRMAGSFSILAQQFDFTKGIISSLVSPVGLLAGALAGLAYAAYKGDASLRMLQNSFQLSGNMAGFSVSSFRLLADELSSELSISVSKASDLLSTFSRSGHLSQDSVKSLSETVVMFSRKSGESLDDSLKHFEGFGRGATEAAKQIMEEGLIPLSYEEYKYIETLDKKMEKEKASAFLIETVKNRLKDMSDNTSTAAGMWRVFTTEISGAFTEMGKLISQTYSLEEQIGNLKIKMNLKNNLGLSTKGDQRDLEGMEKEKGYEEAYAQEEKAQTQKRKHHTENMGFLDSLGHKHSSIHEEMTARLKQVAQEENLSAKDVAERQLEIDRRYAPLKPKKASTKGQANEMDFLKEELAQQESAQELKLASQNQYYTKANEDALKFWKTNFNDKKLTEKEKVSISTTIANLERQIAKGSLDERKAQLEAELSTYKTNFEAKRAILVTERGMYAEGTVEYSRATKRIEQLDQEATSYHKKVLAAQAKENRDSQINDLAEKEVAAKALLASGTANTREILTQLKGFLKEKLALQLEEVDREIAVENDAKEQDILKLQQLTNRKLALQKSYYTQVRTLETQAAKESSKRYEEAGKLMSTYFNNAAFSIIRGGKNMHKSLQQSWNQMMEGFVRMCLDMAKVWAMKEIKNFIITKAMEEQKAGVVGMASKLIEMYQTMTGTTVVAKKAAETTAVVAGNATQAATGAAAAVAPTPYIGPMLAIAAFAAIMALCMGSIGGASHSAAGGMDIGNFEPLTQLHAKEMVLPAPIAEGMRNIISGGNGSNQTSKGSTNNININFHGISDMDSFKRSELDIHRQFSTQLRRYGK